MDKEIELSKKIWILVSSIIMSFLIGVVIDTDWISNIFFIIIFICSMGIMYYEYKRLELIGDEK
ncbi:MAG: hypothetical protein KAS32_31380 [Candidatus Peribacteraceae bacterium]|nr:hypothetical protein [Candidatus Peribacteraceae bacterium]